MFRFTIALRPVLCSRHENCFKGGRWGCETDKLRMGASLWAICGINAACRRFRPSSVMPRRKWKVYIRVRLERQSWIDDETREAILDHVGVSLSRRVPQSRRRLLVLSFREARSDNASSGLSGTGAQNLSSDCTKAITQTHED